MTDADDCVFCRIVEGTLPASRLVETDNASWGSNPERSELDAIAQKITAELTP